MNGVSIERVSFRYGTALEIPFGDHTFTHMLSVEAPEHFDTREKFFYEAARVLKLGGVLVMSDYSLNRIPEIG